MPNICEREEERERLREGRRGSSFDQALIIGPSSSLDFDLELSSCQQPLFLHSASIFMLKWQLHCDGAQHSKIQQSLDLRLNSYVFLFVFCVVRCLVNAGSFSQKRRSIVLAAVVYHVTGGRYFCEVVIFFLV